MAGADRLGVVAVTGILGLILPMIMVHRFMQRLMEWLFIVAGMPDMVNWCKLTMVMEFILYMAIIPKTWLKLDSQLKKDSTLPEWAVRVIVQAHTSIMKFGLMIML